MLKPVGGGASALGTTVPIGEAAYPVPFPHGLEFNPPAHGGWNIVHIGMLVPQAHQIYVCGTNCMRGVILTAAEMNASDRFSFVILEEEDLIEGTVEEITIQGVADVLDKLPQLPPAVLLFTVCVHRFLGCDLDRIYGELEARFPQVTFVRCFMEPISQKKGLSPDQRLRKGMYDPLEPLPCRENSAAVLGSNFALGEAADLPDLLAGAGWQLRQIQQCADYPAYLKLGEAELFLSTFPRARYGAEETAKRLGRRHLYLPSSFTYRELEAQRRQLGEALGVTLPLCDGEIAACEADLADTLALVGETPIAIDYTVHPRPLGLARLLLSHGFRVETVYLDSISPEEEADFQWLRAHAPQLTLSATIQAPCRVLPRGGEKTLAVGQLAAWFRQTPHFVNLVEGGGLWGFAGIREMLRLIRTAYTTQQDTRDLIPRKGLGCDSCI